MECASSSRLPAGSPTAASAPPSTRCDDAMSAMTQPQVNREVAREHGLTDEEYERLTTTLGRTPTIEELGVATVMWSEHCSYKSSRVHLKKLPTEGKRVVQGPGENAGAVSIGQGLALVFKIESHNHPSYIEPYQ